MANDYFRRYMTGQQSLLDDALWAAQNGQVPADMVSMSPSLRDRATDYLRESFPNSGWIQRQAPNVAGLLDFVPGVGNAMGVQEGSQLVDEGLSALERGDYRSGAINSALGGLGVIGSMIPGGGKSGKGSKKLGRYLTGGTKGNYRGTNAFGGINPQKLGVARRNYLADATAGADASKYWYDDTSRDLFNLTGQQVPDADKLANVMATYSSRTPVGTNTMYGFKGWNEDLTGMPLTAGGFPNAMNKKVKAIMSGVEPGTSGLKREPYAEGLSVNWRPNPNIRPTNDIHQVRAWGVTDPKTGKPWSKGVGKAGHQFLDDQSAWAVEQMNLRAQAAGEPMDWNNYRLQAAAWAPQRFRAGLAPDIQSAAKHYGDFIGENSGLLTREWTPGETSGHLPELLGMPLATRQAYADALEAPVIGPNGIDNIVRGMGPLSAPTLPNLGVYEGNINPGFVSQVPVGKLTGTQQIDAASEKVMNAVASAHGLLGLQDQAAWNYAAGKPSNVSAGAYDFVRPGGPLSPDELARLRERTQALGIDMPIASPSGARVLMFDETKPTTAQRKKLAKELQAAGAEFGAELQPRVMSSNIIPENKPAPGQWSSKPYIAGIEAAGPRVVENFNRTMQTIAPAQLAATEAFAKQHGLTQAPYYRPMMEALSTGGLDALKALVAKGIVPVTALYMVGQAMTDSQGQDTGAGT